MRKKLYKDGKHWTTGYGKYFVAAAMVTTGVTALNDEQNQAFASTVLTTDTKNALEVDVPTEAIDSAVKNAENSGINVSADAPISQTITSDKTDSTVDEIKSSYQNQANSINQSVQQISDAENKLNQAQSGIENSKVETINTTDTADYLKQVDNALVKLDEQNKYQNEFQKIGTDVYWVNGQTDVFDINGNKVLIDKNSLEGRTFAAGFNAGGENSNDWDGGSDSMRHLENGQTFIIRGAKSSSGVDVGDIKITFNDLKGWGSANDFAINFFNFKPDNNGRSAIGVSITSRNGSTNTGMQSFSWNIQGSNDIKTVVVNDIDALQSITTPGKIIQVGDKVSQTSDNTAIGRSEIADDGGGSGFTSTGVKVENGQGRYQISTPINGAVSITISLFGYDTGMAKITPTTFDIKKPTLHYQLTDLNVQQLNQKESQVDEDGVDDNGKNVSKNQLVNFPLLNDALPQDRVKNIESYEVVDVMSGDLKTTQELVDNNLKKAKLDDLWIATVSGGDENGGQTISYKATEKLLNEMNKDKTVKFDVPDIPLVGFATKDGVEVNNKFKTTINNEYIVESNEVVNKTPNPKPDKEVSNLNGINIDGKTVMPGTNNIYDLNWDLSVYKDVVASKDQIAKGFYFIDDYPESVFDDVENQIKNVTLIDSDGQKVTGVTANVYKNINDAPLEMRNMIENSIKSGYIKGIDGSFIIWSADNSNEFFEKYIKKGIDIKIKLPLKVSDSADNVEFKNTAFQFDFGQGYQTKTVLNNVPDIQLDKEVLKNDDNSSANNQDISVGDYGYYSLDAPAVPKTENGLGEPIYELSGFDALFAEYDRYTGTYKIKSTTDIVLKDKSDTNVDLWNQLKGLTSLNTNTIPSGTDISKFVKVSFGNYQLPETKNGYVFTHDVFDIDGKKYSAGDVVPSGVILKDVFYWSFDKEFLNSLDPNSGIDYQIDLQFQRMKNTNSIDGGYVLNDANFRINGVNFKTDTVKTSSLVKNDPIENPTINNNQMAASILPQTGYEQNNFELIGLSTLITATAAIYIKRKKY